jgi:murein L,D-transpeptidase YcbB/YkuD
MGANDEQVPPAAPASVRELLADIGMIPAHGPSDLDAALRRFQASCGLDADGVAGPKTVHLLARCAAEGRELRELGLVA